MSNQITLTLNNHLEELNRLHDTIARFFQQKSLSDEICNEMQLVAEELLVNTIQHGYTDKQQHNIEIILTYSNHFFTLSIKNDAKAFNPLLVPTPPLGLNSEQTVIGGLGLPLIKALSDTQQYCYENQQNIVTIGRAVPAQSSSSAT